MFGDPPMTLLSHEELPNARCREMAALTALNKREVPSKSTSNKKKNEDAGAAPEWPQHLILAGKCHIIGSYFANET
jgi:hypothetical protein